MNFLIPLILGIILGYLLRNKIKVNTEVLMSASVVALVFLMGIKAGEVEVSATKAVLYSLTLMLFAVVGSIGVAKVLWREIK
ncbi:hypothetical protein A3L04_05915 [Thermococcus chitonophagus]|uniref:DUF340 domain-containing protein n=1 Tax=Thermococcus chitonophagus TaxID=54262 RepID=A0A160VS22_9EURY|nr:hypothetical protein [Thermococcus chitonophagus]ASJ16636.1 hypothetical protein A3L04_05915 [Thermococcus chitonophagus]CUX77439.1 hypothetical protein CHITON_0660 [Thermococcus chitonophagus]